MGLLMALNAWEYPRHANDGLSDAQIAAIMAHNIDADGIPGVRRTADGTPDVSVWAGELHIQTDSSSVADLDALCEQIAADTRNPATGQSLGFSINFVGPFSDSSHDCRP